MVQNTYNLNPLSQHTYLPTKFSSTELFPALCPPTTAICGRSSCIWTPNCVKASWSLLTIGMSCSIPVFPAIIADVHCTEPQCLQRLRFVTEGWKTNMADYPWYCAAYYQDRSCVRLSENYWRVVYTVHVYM